MPGLFVCRMTIGVVALASAALAACSDPEQPTDLRTSGPPNVTAVMVMTDLETSVDPSPVGLGRIVETATFCRLNDDKRPGLIPLPDIRTVTVCPIDLKEGAEDLGKAEGAPPVWFVRIVFDQLLNPSIEDLVPEIGEDGNPTGDTIGTLRNTLPVTLKCTNSASVMADVPYDGAYIPNGNKSGWPPGPALIIQPAKATSVPTGAMCSVSIKDNVHNKRGNSVPLDQRDYQFMIGQMVLRMSSLDGLAEDVTDGSIVIDAKTPVDLFWTAAIDHETPGGTTEMPIIKSKVDATKVKISSGANAAGGMANAAVCAGNGTPVDSSSIGVLVRGIEPTTTELVLRLDVKGGVDAVSDHWDPGTTYLITFDAGAVVRTSQGGPDGTFPDGYKLCFHTAPSP